MRTKLKFLYYVFFGAFLAIGFLGVWVVERFRVKVTLPLQVGTPGVKHLVFALPRQISEVESLSSDLRFMTLSNHGAVFSLALPPGEWCLYAVPMDRDGRDDLLRDLKNVVALVKLDPTVAVPFPGNPILVKKRQAA